MGRAGSGSSGGGHSSGSHSSSRSSGGHSISSHRSGSSFSHSRSYSSSSHGSGSSYHRSYSHTSPSRNYSNPQQYYDTYHGYGGGGYYPSSPTRHRNNAVGGLGSTMLLAISIVIIAIVIGVIANIQDRPTSSRDRDKLTQVPAFDSDCVVDELYWFDNVNSAGNKLRNFYDETGIQPYIYLRAYDSSLRTNEEKEEYALSLFDELGLSENTFLYVYFAEEDTDNDVGYMCYVNGKMVDSIMDDEAIDIFWGYIDSYWYTDISTDELFQDVFNRTAAIIMRRSTTAADILIVIAIGAAVIGALFVIYMIMKTKRKNEAEKAKETERILSTPMQDLVKGSESDPLVDKYK